MASFLVTEKSAVAKAKSEPPGKLFVKRGEKSHDSPTELLSSKKQRRPLVSKNYSPRRESAALTQTLLLLLKSMVHKRPSSCPASVQPTYTTLQAEASIWILNEGA